MARIRSSVYCFPLLATLAIGGCYDPHKKYTLDPLAEVQAGESEQVARRAAPFADDLVRYLRGAPREGGDVFALRLEFEPGGFAPLMDTIADLEALLVIMRDFPALRVAVEGHTDNEGDSEKNLKLSQWRADWVRRFLLERGIAADRVQAHGFGDTDPIADNSTAAGQQQNRRLVIRILNFDRQSAAVPSSR
ncbi:Outer membrane protein OmpA [Microbulbifer donghaiensis]|uniref:Outer membrane protein OmpA n=1 Tax=Microbulbifer donghaiensis TaxID=494016 RepID=A0A1M5FE43_9GAMM|nr:OmpA family protein [Microbulbifer donghaiensis]SHF89793.1 Outer membrane protein OmpA [Microbulbifer donghaiensis]